MLAVPPLAFVKNDESEAVLILHLGRSLCGHDGIIHGGMIATIFDEALGRNVRHLVMPGKRSDSETDTIVVARHFSISLRISGLLPRSTCNTRSLLRPTR